jgi:hypothetical protein
MLVLGFTDQESENGDKPDARHRSVTAAAGGYTLDSSGAGGPQLEPTPLRATREEDGPPAGPRGDSDHTAVAVPTPGPPYGARRLRGAGDRTDYAVDRPPHLPLARAVRTARRGPRLGCGGGPAVAQRQLHVLEQQVTTTQPTRTVTVSHPGAGDQARGAGPHPQSTRLRAQAGRTPAPPAQRRLGTRRSPSQERSRLVTGGPPQGRRDMHAVNQTAVSGGQRHRPGATAGHPGPHRLPSRGGNASHHRRPNPGPPSQSRSTRPWAEAGRAPPRRNGDSEHTHRPVGECSDPPTAGRPGPTAPGRPRARAGQPATQRHGDSDLTTATHWSRRSRRATRLRGLRAGPTARKTTRLRAGPTAR